MLFFPEQLWKIELAFKVTNDHFISIYPTILYRQHSNLYKIAQTLPPNIFLLGCKNINVYPLYSSRGSQSLHFAWFWLLKLTYLLRQLCLTWCITCRLIKTRNIGSKPNGFFCKHERNLWCLFFLFCDFFTILLYYFSMEYFYLWQVKIL